MSKSEGGRSEAVEDGWVDPVAVLVAVSATEGEDVQLVHVVRSQHYGQPLVVCDVLGKGSTMTLSFTYLSTCICATSIFLASW